MEIYPSHHYWTTMLNTSNYFPLFHFALQGGSNRFRGFKWHSNGCPLFQSIKKEGFRQIIKSAGNLYFKRSTHILRNWIVSKCGFTYLSNSPFWYNFIFPTLFYFASKGGSNVKNAFKIRKHSTFPWSAICISYLVFTGISIPFLKVNRTSSLP